MQQYDDSQIILRQYLLGELAEEKQRQLEEQFLTDDKYFAELLVAEDELVDQYVDDTLSEQERERFAQHFLITAERHRKLSFAKALRRYISDAEVAKLPDTPGGAQQPAPWKGFLPPFLRARSPLHSFSFAAALLLVVIGGSWFVMKNWFQRNPSEQNSSRAVFTVILTPGMVRGTGKINKVVIPANVETVQFELEMAASEQQSYRANIETEEGRSVFSADGLKPTGAERTIILSVPASLLAPGDYQVKLSGLTAADKFEDVGRYYFRVASK